MRFKIKFILQDVILDFYFSISVFGRVPKNNDIMEAQKKKRNASNNALTFPKSGLEEFVN